MASEASNQFFCQFSIYLEENFGRPEDPQSKEVIRNGDKKVRRLDSLARLIIKDKTDNCAAVALVNNVWYFTANNYDKIKDNIKLIFKALRIVEIDKGRVVSTRNARNSLIDSYLGDVVNNPNIKTRLIKDVKKFLSALKTDDVFTSSEIETLVSKHYWFLRNPRHFHAEMDLLLYSVRTFTNDTTITIGISKLCCRLCASGVDAFKNRYQHLGINLRGRHGNFYFGWVPPRLLLKDCFEDFVGESAYSIYSEASPQIQEEIKKALFNLEENRGALEKFFIPKRGGVNLNSVSPAPPNTEEARGGKDELSIENPDDEDELCIENPDDEDELSEGRRKELEDFFKPQTESASDDEDELSIENPDDSDSEPEN